MSQETLDQIWLGYARKVIPLNAPELQFDEMKKAFYCGAFAALQSVIYTPEDMPDDKAADHLSAIFEESKAFVEICCLPK